MEINTELRQLSESFRSYRNVLKPLQESLSALANSFDYLNNDLNRLENTLGQDTRSQIEKIYSTIKTQEQNNIKLTESIDNFLKSSENYEKRIEQLSTKFTLIEEKINLINSLENQAEGQLKKLEKIIDEKKLNYNVKDLQKSLEVYNKNVEKISEFINGDVAEVLVNNGKKIDLIKKSNEELTTMLSTQSADVSELLTTYKTTNTLLKNMVEKDTVNEEYIFDLLDKWAEKRKVKIKK